MAPMDTVSPFALCSVTTAFTVVPTGFFSTNARYGITSFAIRTRVPGGGVRGTGIGLLASGLGVWSLRTTEPAFTDFLLVGPRAGTRSTNTHPTCGTGLPPMRRPWSNNHLYLPWNSW